MAVTVDDWEDITQTIDPWGLMDRAHRPLQGLGLCHLSTFFSLHEREEIKNFQFKASQSLLL